MRSIAALALLAFTGLSFAQGQQQQSYPYTIDPSSVPDSLRQTWCDNQKSQCPLICLQQPDVTTLTTITNDCDPDTLVYSCVCENNVAPNITQYTQTIPYYVCTEWGNQCVTNCGMNNNECANNCRADHPCGAQAPNKPNTTASSTTSTASATGSATGGSESIPVTGLLGATATSSPNNKGAASAMLNLGQSYGMAVVFAGVFAGFALIL
ncbi:hypothetical protein BDV96DRAFT_488613 [Lophiotrema nucula]|uniref:DUF7707 domain-containing protein n=1 Tax=Lophiotrema nucula TaxID=690887 RepID=A0A6A5ZGR7_9PLEO|nr:hypothetical protein BDV96DRAFT_488613 [Lophiotrema nucula]